MASLTRLHITGCPRSGTTLLMELAATCFASDGRCQHEQSIFEPADISDGLYISKQPNDIRHLRHIFHRDPKLYIIYLVRDPRSVITSTHRETPDRYFCNYRIWLECEKAAAEYMEHPRFLRLRYEDLVADPDHEQERIAGKFTYLQKCHRFSEYYQFARPSKQARQALSGLRPIDQSSVDKWRLHLPRIAHQYQRHKVLADDLIRLGYEPDREWLKLLSGVEAKEGFCRYPENREVIKEWEKAVRVYLKSRRYLNQMAG